MFSDRLKMAQASSRQKILRKNYNPSAVIEYTIMFQSSRLIKRPTSWKKNPRHALSTFYFSQSYFQRLQMDVLRSETVPTLSLLPLRGLRPPAGRPWQRESLYSLRTPDGLNSNITCFKLGFSLPTNHFTLMEQPQSETKQKSV